MAGSSAKSNKPDWTIDVKESKECSICQQPLEQQSGGDIVQPLEAQSGAEIVRLQSCGHAFHTVCFQEYLCSQIVDAQLDFKCFVLPAGGSKQCKAPISRKEVLALIPDTMKEKFEVFSFFHDNPQTGRQCSKCKFLQVGSPSEPRMICKQCTAEYCFFHGDAHPANTSCADYDASTAGDRALAAAVLAKHTKPCPGCAAPIEKAEGCNQVQCPRCHANFCWICGKAVDTGVFPLHYQWWNVFGCPNRQLGNLTEGFSPLQLKIWQFFYALTLTVITPVSFVLTLGFGIACCVCAPIWGVKDYVVGCFSFWGTLILALLAVALCPVWGILLCCYACVSAALQDPDTVPSVPGAGADDDVLYRPQQRGGLRSGAAAVHVAPSSGQGVSSAAAAAAERESLVRGSASPPTAPQSAEVPAVVV